MNKWEKIEAEFENTRTKSEAKEIADEIMSRKGRTTFIYVEGPAIDTFNLHAQGGANRLYQQTMVEGWNRRNGKVCGRRQMRIFI